MTKINIFLDLVFRIGSRLIVIFYKIIYFFISFAFYKSIKFSTYISPFASVKNKKKLKIGGNSIINRNVCLWGELNIGNHVQINPNTCIYGKCTIGNFVMIAPNCTLAGGTHGINFGKGPMIYQPCVDEEIIIEDDVWIGANCVITKGVRIGSGAVIGAGTVVRKNVPPNAVVGYPYGFTVKFLRSDKKQ